VNADTVDLMDAAADDPLPIPTIHEPSSEMDAASVEHLLMAIARIRGERDTLKRNMSFLEYESKFAIEALEAKLAASSSSIAEASETICQLRMEVDSLSLRLAKVTDRGAKAIQEKNQHIRRLSLTAIASATVIGHLHSQGSSLEQRVIDVYASCSEMQDRLIKSGVEQEELAERLKECEVKLDVTVLCLEATTSQRNDLMAQLDLKDGERESEVGELKIALQESQDNLEHADMRLAEVSKSLQDVESERDSLTLQTTNLLTDLRVAQDDLTNAETRYSSLQFHQLSSMSSNEATRALQDQIGELEMRIMRRTEQIGIHQHDIKRLETNLRLSEEHIDELAMELEMATAQKNAMVEDCADAREARDEALVRLDQLEANMEAKIDDGDAAIVTLVGVVMETVGSSRITVKRLHNATQLAKEELHRLKIAHQGALLLLEKIPTLESRLSSSSFEVIQLTLALASSQVQLNHGSTSIDRLQKENDDLAREVQRQQDDLDKRYVESASLQQQLENLQYQASAEASTFAIQRSELEAQIHDLQASITTMEDDHRMAVAELETSKEHQNAFDATLEGEIAALKSRHGRELADMQGRLAQTSDALKALQTHHKSVENDHQLAMSDAARSRQELEERLAEASEGLARSLQEREQFQVAQRETEDEILRLQHDLDVALADAKQAQTSRDEIKVSYQQTSDELARLQLEQESHISRATEQFLAIQQRLEGELVELQSRFDEQSLRLEQAIQEADQLSRELQTEVSGRSEDRETHEKQLHLTNEQCHHTESSLAVLNQNMDFAKGQLEQSRQELETLQEENVCLQEEITTLEAEIQRSISLNRFLESQVKERFDFILVLNVL
jgi:chromosome segregation ATPase